MKRETNSRLPFDEFASVKENVRRQREYFIDQAVRCVFSEYEIGSLRATFGWRLRDPRLLYSPEIQNRFDLVRQIFREMKADSYAQDIE